MSRTTREKAERMRYAAQFLESEEAATDVQQLATDYIALLEENERLKERADRLEKGLFQIKITALGQEQPAWALEDVLACTRSILMEDERILAALATEQDAG